MSEIFCSGLGFPEGPVLLPDGTFLCVEMTPETGCITHLSSDGSERNVLATTGRPNGLARDADGFVWIAETEQAALLRMSPDGNIETIADNCDGASFLFLNDVAIGPDGNIYLTDSGIRAEEVVPDGELHPQFRSLHYDGRLFRISRDGTRVECIDSGIKFANGLAFSPSGEFYANETLTGNIYRYGSGRRELFGNVIREFDDDLLKGPDGMKFAADGRLFACVFGEGQVTALSRDGSVDCRFETQGMMPTNLVFGSAGEQTIYVTEAEQGRIERIHVGVDGLTLCA